MRVRTSAIGFFLASLMLAGSFASLVPVASAQIGGQVNTITFDRNPANYAEGSNITINFQNVQPVDVVRIHCLTCPDNRTYYSATPKNTLFFPGDFPAAKSVAQPRWNDTWLVEEDSGGRAIASADFFTWLGDVHKFPGNSPFATATIKFFGTGYTPGTLVQFLMRHRTADGTFDRVWVIDVTADRGGNATYQWTLPKDETKRMNCPPRAAGYCALYELRAMGEGKDIDVLRFRIVPATLVVTPHISPHTAQGLPGIIERTQNATMGAEIRYPDLEILTTADVAGGVDPNGTLDVKVVRIDGSNPGAPTTARATVPAAPDAFTHWWFAHWDVPRDEPLAVYYSYRMTLNEHKDRYGNVVPQIDVANFTLQKASLSPHFVVTPASVERLATAKVVAAFLYHDGTPMKPGDNATAVTGCFWKDQEGPANCAQGIPAKVNYWENGSWNFTHVFPRDFPDLSLYRVVFTGDQANGADRWGNVFATNLSAPFLITPAKIRVNLTTFVGGQQRNATRGFDRGDTVQLAARLTYPDGSAFDKTKNQNEAAVIPVELDKHDASGALISSETLNFTNDDSDEALWAATEPLNLTSSGSPVGVWTYQFTLTDNVTPPNGNDTTFRRAVHPAKIVVVNHLEPTPRDKIGSTVTYRFQLVYQNGGKVPESDVGSRLVVDVIRRIPIQFAFTSVSGHLFPEFDPATGDWVTDWVVPRELFVGIFQFHPSGADRFGNIVDPKAASKLFSTYADTTTREPLGQPPFTAERGTPVTAVFDGRDGDVGDRGFPGTHPRIEVQRLDPATSLWVTELRDVWVNYNTEGDHVAQWNTTLSSTLGTYRFFLIGRDNTFNIINGTSDRFTLLPTNVTRSLLLPPPDHVGKGELITFSVERQPGDVLQHVDVQYNGQPLSSVIGRVALSPPIAQALPDRFNVSWRVPFQLETGNYSFTASGEDLFHNHLTAEVAPIAAEPSVLAGTVLGQPDKLVKRGVPVDFLFAVTYPNGDFFAAHSPPRVYLVNSSGIVETLPVDHAALSFQSSWTAPFDAPLTDYWFEVSGQDDGGNVYPALRSDNFHLAPGVFTRNFVAATDGTPSFSYARLQAVRVQVPTQPTDRFIGFTLNYVSDANNVIPNTIDPAQAQRIANLPYTLDTGTGHYKIEWVTDRTTRPGVYTIDFSGTDAYGNEFQGTSTPFLVHSTNILVNFIGTPTAGTLQLGKSFDATFTLKYVCYTSACEVLNDTAGQPSVAMLYDGAPAKQRPTVRFDAAQGLWVASWVPPALLPPGQYTMVVQGSDDSGNNIVFAASPPQTVEQSLTQSFLKIIPDAGLPLLLLGVAVVALALAGVRRKR
ncbi:MAG: hypothetical protein ACYDCK_11925 [Thermoplasmatota archaeon]